MKYALLFFISLLFYSCHNYIIVNDYKKADISECSCFIDNNWISIDKINVSKSKYRAKCVSNLIDSIQNSLIELEANIDSIYETGLLWDNNVDSLEKVNLQNQITNHKAFIDSLNSKWVRCEINLKTKRVFLNREISDSTERLKIRYYSTNKKIGRSVYINDSLVKSNFR